MSGGANTVSYMAAGMGTRSNNGAYFINFRVAKLKLCRKIADLFNFFQNDNMLSLDKVIMYMG